MSWKGLPHQTEANVPDYIKKMLQSRYPSGSGWSSTQPSGLSTYPARNGGNYGLGSSAQQYGESSLPRSPYRPYQPSKYGLASESSTYDPALGPRNFRDLDFAEALRGVGEDGLDHGLVYGTDSYDFPKYDSKSTYRTELPPPARDYSSDSGMNYRRKHNRSMEYDLERPNLLTDSHKPASVDDFFVSPNKSQVPIKNYNRYTASRRDSEGEDILYNSDRRDSSYNSEPRNSFNTEPRDSFDTDRRDMLSTDERDSSGNAPPVEPRRDSPESAFMSPPLFNSRDRESSDADALSSSAGNITSDLTNWQKQHRSQLLHPDDDRQDMAVYDHHRRRSPSPQDTGRGQVEQVRNVADAVIRDKNAIIEKLRRQVMELEDANRLCEAKLRRTLMTTTDGLDMNLAKVQDLEIENAELRNDLKEVKSRKNAEIEDLESKLGAAEHEIVQLQAELRKRQPNRAEIEAKLKQKDDEVEEWKTKFTQMKTSHHDMKEKLDHLERYISDLPTAEQFAKNTEELAFCHEENQVQKEQIEELEDKLMENQELLSDREMTIQELECKQEQLAEKMGDLTREITRIKSGGQGLVLQQTQEKLAMVKAENEKLSSSLDKAKKLLERNHQKMRHFEVKHQNDTRQLQERLTQEEESVMALREEIRLKDEQGLKYKKSLKDLACKNQDLMDQTLILKEQIRHLEQQCADDGHDLQRRYVREMATCFSELESVVHFCLQRAEGKDPDLSMLLDVGSHSLEEEGASSGGGMEEKTLKQWLKKVKALRGDVEKLRGKISNKIAEELGENMNCNTQ